MERDSECGSSRCPLSKLENLLDLSRYWLDVEWDLESAARSCTIVNGMTTHDLGSRAKLWRRILCTLSFFDSTLSNLTLLCSVVFRKTHARFPVDRRSLHLRYYIPDAPNFPSTSTSSSIAVECH